MQGFSLVISFFSNILVVCFIIVGVDAASTTSTDSIVPLDLLNAFFNASWIWTPEANAPSAPPAERAFLKSYSPPSGKISTGAIILITADNYFSGLYVNGIFIGATANSSTSWENALIFNVSLPKTTNSILFGLRADNNADAPGDPDGGGPAGLLVAVKMLFSDGTSTLLGTDSSWTGAKTIALDWQLPSSNQTYESVNVLFPYGQGPWASDVVLPTAFSLSASPITSSSASSSPISLPSPTGAINSSNSSGTLGSGAIAGVAVGGLSVLLGIIATVFLLRKRLMRKKIAWLSHSSLLDLDELNTPYSNDSFHNLQEIPTHKLQHRSCERLLVSQHITKPRETDEVTGSATSETMYPGCSVAMSSISPNNRNARNKEIIMLQSQMERMKQIVEKLSSGQNLANTPPKYEVVNQQR